MASGRDSAHLTPRPDPQGLLLVGMLASRPVSVPSTYSQEGFQSGVTLPTYQTGEAYFVWAQNAFVFRLIPNMRLVTTRPSEQRMAARRPARLLPGMGLPTGRFGGDLSAHRWRWPPGFADIGRDRNQHFPKLPRVCSQQMRGGGGGSSAVCCECKLRSSNNATPRSLCGLHKNK